MNEAIEQTLTYQQKLVKRSLGLNPVPNHYLVVYKKAREGWTLRECLPPGRKPRRLPFESPDSFVTYAVVADRELRHHFAGDYRSHDQVHTFTLDLTIEFRVSAPTALVEDLDRDPLRRLQEETSKILVQATKGLDWAFIERERIPLEELLFGTNGAAGGREPASHLDKLRRFAAGIGFEVYRVAVARQLPPQEIKNQVVLLQHHTQELEETLSQDLALKLGARGKQFERSEKLADTVADGTGVVLGRELDSARSISELGTTLQQVAGVYSTLHGAAPSILRPPGPALTAGGTGAPQALLGAGGMAATAPAPLSPISPLSGLLADLADRFGRPGGDATLRCRVLPAALHLVAEVLRGASAEEIEEHAAAVQRLFVSSFQALPLDKDQILLLQRLQDTGALRVELGGA